MGKDIDNYIPIDCGLHSEYELAIMHKTKINLSWIDSDNLKHTESVMPIDLVIKTKQEFLKIQTQDNKINEIRLDKIIEFIPIK